MNSVRNHFYEMRLNFIKSLLFCVVVSIVATEGKADCVLPLPRFRFFAPLIFTSDGDLLPTDNDNEHALTITIPDDEEVILSCAPNYFKNPTFNSSKRLSAQCANGENLDVDGIKNNWITDLGCEVRPVEEILKPIPGCLNGATSVEFGYENPIKRKTQVLGEACYSKTEGSTIFVHTKFIKNGNSKSAVLETEGVNYLAQRHPDSTHKIDFLVAAQLDELNARLEKLLSSKKVPFLELRHFIDLPILQNGQLYSALKLGWNFAVTNGYDHLPNYDSLLKDIMELNEHSFDLYLGTHSVLSLKAGSRDVDVYLLPDDEKYPVPKYLWAVVTTELGKGVGFLVSNNIEADEADLMAKAPCESVCTQLSWLSNLLENDAYKEPKNGYIFCCELDSFMKSVHEMPPLEGKFNLLISQRNTQKYVEVF